MILTLGVFSAIAVQASALVRLTPSGNTTLRPLDLYCCIGSKVYGTQDKVVNKTVVMNLEREGCDVGSYDGKAVITVVDSSYQSPCAQTANNNLDANNMKEFATLDAFKTRYFFNINKKGWYAGISYFQRYDFSTEIKVMGYFNCEFPQSISQTDFENLYLRHNSSVTMFVEGEADENRWLSVWEGKPYRFVFWYLLPFLFLVNFLTSATLFVHKLCTIKTPDGSLLRAVLREKGGRTSVTATLLFMETVSSFFLSVVGHLGGVYSRDRITANWMAFFAPGLLVTSLGTTILAGVFWFDRRAALERRANFIVNDNEQPFFTRHRKKLIVGATSCIFLDAIVGVFVMMRVPGFEAMAGALAVCLSVMIAVTFLAEAYKFRFMIKSLVKNLAAKSSRSINTASPGISRMVRVSRWFVLSACTILCFAAASTLLIVWGDKMYRPKNWATYFGISHILRWFMSFCQIMMCVPDKFFSSRIRVGYEPGWREEHDGTTASSVTGDKATVLESSEA